MIVRAKNLATEKEINLNVNHIISFEPGVDEKTSVIQLSNGMVVIIDLTNRSLRHAVKTASQISETD